jgi:hypothetical protein
VAILLTALTALETFAKAKRILGIICSGNSSITISGSGIIMVDFFSALMGN